MGSARRLADAGCDFFVCPDNTAHIALDAATEPYPLPGLHIADIVAARARADGRKRIALLGTRWTMEGPAYPAAFERAGLGMATPTPADRALLNRIIFDELCQGIVSEPARAELVRMIAALKRDGCDAVRAELHGDSADRHSGGLAAADARLHAAARARRRRRRAGTGARADLARRTSRLESYFIFGQGAGSPSNHCFRLATTFLPPIVGR